EHQRVDDRAKPPAVRRQHVLDEARSLVAHLAAEDAGPFELDQALRERPRGDLAQHLPELGEAGAALVRRVQDRDGVAPLEDVRRAPDLLRDRVPRLTPPPRTGLASPRE